MVILLRNQVVILKWNQVLTLKRNGVINITGICKIDDDLYFIEETLIYEDGKTYSNIIFLTVEDNKWKVAMNEEK